MTTSEMDSGKSEKNSEKNSETKTNIAPYLIFRNPKLILYALGVYAGLVLFFLASRDSSILEIIKENGLKYAGLLITFLSSIFMMAEMSNVMRERKEERFIDVDSRRRRNNASTDTEVILSEIKELKGKQVPFDYEKIEKLINETRSKSAQFKKETYANFESYFSGIVYLLEEKARIADEKASILLDKGTSYSKGGIVFFVISIIAWQVLSLYYGFKDQYIYGIVSCSLLFVFIEFLSAWFLKQYRHFIDTSTYLIKVKAIFDRYILSYLALNSPVLSENSKNCSKLINILSDDIKWPESYLMKNSDISFAKEAMEAMTHFAKAIKTEAISKTNKDKAE